MKLLIYSSTSTPRLEYVCHQIFRDWLGFQLDWTNDTTQYKNYIGFKLNYGTTSLENNDFLLPKSTLLFENNLTNQPLFPVWYNKIPALFPLTIPNAIFPFDLLAAIFFHLSRYEEYLPFQADRHGRFPASESWAYQNDCLQLPIIDLLVIELKNQLKKRFPAIVFKQQAFQFSPTYDIDMAWAFKHKGWKRNIGGYFNDLLKGQFFSFKKRFQTHFLFQKDPFQTFDWLDGLSRKFDFQPTYFFLLGDYALYDTNNSSQAKPFQQLIQAIAALYKIGIHPSYQSSGNQFIINTEKQRLAGITQQTIHRSRQHFLKLHLPQTYRQLIQAGIKADYSMGYAMDTGFRPGTSLPFYWYDLAAEKSTDLLIHPFQVMDVTLKDYLKLSPEAAKAHVQQLLHRTKSVNGIFCSLWHNSSFSALEGWNEWAAVYVDLLENVTLEA